MNWTELICAALRLGWMKTARQWYGDARRAGAQIDERRIRETAERAKAARNDG